jgi:hypothetical protein
MRFLKLKAEAFRRAVVVLASVAVIATGSAGAAAASTGTGLAHAPAASFTAQARAAGLTATQAAAFQTKVARESAEVHGTQVAANEIKLPDGGALLLPLPGQRIARVLPGAVNLGFSTRTRPASGAVRGAAMVPADSNSLCWNGGSNNCCPYYDICSWSQQWGYGTEFIASACNSNQELPGSGIWDGVGSWLNNQTQGTSAFFLNKSQQVIYTTPVAASSDTDYNWAPVWYIDACNH